MCSMAKIITIGGGKIAFSNFNLVPSINDV